MFVIRSILNQTRTEEEVSILSREVNNLLILKCSLLHGSGERTYFKFGLQPCLNGTTERDGRQRRDQYAKRGVFSPNLKETDMLSR